MDLEQTLIHQLTIMRFNHRVLKLRLPALMNQFFLVNTIILVFTPKLDASYLELSVRSEKISSLSLIGMGRSKMMV